MPTETVAVVDPRTGVAFKPEELTDELLVEILVELQRREHQMTEWRRAAEDEMVRRVGDLETVIVASRAYDIERSMSRQWDADELARTLRELVRRGEITAAEADTVIKVSRSVDGTKAARLLAHLDGEPMQMVRDCFTWKKGRARVKPAAPQLEQ